jgi:hypothetical protein
MQPTSQVSSSVQIPQTATAAAAAYEKDYPQLGKDTLSPNRGLTRRVVKPAAKGQPKVPVNTGVFVSEAVVEKLKGRLEAESRKNLDINRGENAKIQKFTLQSQELTKQKNQLLKELETASVDEKKRLKSLFESIDQLKRIAEPTFKKQESKTQNPTLLPGAKELSESLMQTYDGLLKIQSKITDPKQDLSEEHVKSELEPFKKRFAAHQDQYKKLDRAIKQKLQDLENKVAKQKKDKIPQEHFCSIAKFEACDEQKIKEHEEAKEKLMQTRMVRHDAIAAAYIQMKIRLDFVDWAIESINLYAELQSNLKTIEDSLAALLKQIEDLKALIRAHGTAHIEERKVAHTKCMEEYNKLSKKAFLYQQRVEVAKISLLGKQKSFDPSSNVLARMKEVMIWDDSLKAACEKEVSERLALMHRESLVKNQVITKVWDSIYSLTDTKLPADIDRIGVGLYKKDGSIPYDSTFRTFYNDRWVKSPFCAEKPEEVDG